MYLLDTMVVSEMRRRDKDSRISVWLKSVDVEQMFVSSITFGEIAAGLEKPDLDPVFRSRLEAWLLEVKQRFEPRTLDVTIPVAIRWGALAARLKRQDMDLLIAATALEHDLTLVTRNIRHFEPTGVRLLNPYAA
jgi:toxin FitB